MPEATWWPVSATTNSTAPGPPPGERSTSAATAASATPPTASARSSRPATAPAPERSTWCATQMVPAPQSQPTVVATTRARTTTGPPSAVNTAG
ncbi:hypothetical protein GCM10009660_48880 [Catellatospora bangladeshensis]